MAPRRSKRRTNNSNNDAGDEQQPNQGRGPAAERSVAAHVRDRQRAVAEREASRLARPEQRKAVTLAHADRKKSAVTSTPSGVSHSQVFVVSPTNTEWCGPFSVARQMIAKREEARRLREEEESEEGTQMKHPLDAAMVELEMEKKRKLHPSMQWKGSLELKTKNNKNIYAKRQRREEVRSRGKAVPSLFDLCIRFLVDHFEYVESLGEVDTDVRTAIVRELVAAQKLDGHSLPAIAETGIEALEIVDCSSISESELSKRLSELMKAGLRYLMLDQAGRCFGDKAVESIIAGGSATGCHLFALSIGGAYVLKDADAAKLVQATAPSSLEFKACSRLGPQLCQSIPGSYTSSSRLLLELALEDVPLKTEHLQALIRSDDSWKNLKTLSLRRIEALNDEIVDQFLEFTTSTLEGLDLSDNPQLTDAILSSLRLHKAGRLHALTLSGLKHLTAPGLEAFFTFVDGATPPPMLRTLDLGKCDHEAVTDGVIHLATQAATQVGDQQQQAATPTGGLIQLNVQGSTVLTDTALEHLAATSSRTLEDINLSFCPRITDQGLGFLIDKCHRQLAKVHVWGNAQLTDESFDGNRRANDPNLEIAGVWIKKHTTKTIR